MRALRLLAIPALLVLLVVLMVRQWPHRVAPSLLARYGLTEVHLEGLRLTTDSLGLANFSATLARPSGPIGISLTKGECRFNLPALLQGKVEACSAAEATLRLPPSGSGQAGNTLPDLAGILRPQPAPRVPFGQLHVDRMRILRQGGNLAQTLPLALHWTTSAGEGRLVVDAIPAPGGKTGEPLLEMRAADDLLTGKVYLPPAVLSVLLPTTAKGQPPGGTVRGEWRIALFADGDQPFHLLLTVTDLRRAQVQAGELRVQLDGVMAADRGTITLLPASGFLARNGRGQGWAWGQLDGSLAGTFTAAPDRWQLHLRPATPWLIDGMAVGTNRFSRMRLSLDSFDANLDAGEIQASAAVTLPAHRDSLRMDLGWQSTGERQGTCTLRTTKPIALNQTGNPLALLATPAVPLVLNQGSLGFSSHLTWSDKAPPAMRLALDLTDGKGMAGEIPFSGLDVHQELQILPKPATRTPGTITLAALQGPIPLANLHLATVLQPSPTGAPVCTVKGAEVELLGGRVESRDCDYDLGQGHGRCLLAVSGLDLEQVLAVQRVKGLAATGRVSGQLPLRLDRAGMRITQGRLANTTDGLIRYQPDNAPPPGSPLTDYALKALEEFRYHSLVALVDYQPDGELGLRLELQGKSPKLDAERPVHLNIGAQQNLLSLLKSLHYQPDPNRLQPRGR